MKYNPLVSIVIPIYKVEKWLPKCLDSCVNQTYENLEIVAVNDGSPDGCKSIIEKYQTEDDRIRLIDKPNGGVNSAREAGINIATGEYITLLDGDDFLDVRAVETMVSYTQQNCADIVIGRGQYIVNDKNETLDVTIGMKPQVLEGGDYLKYILANGIISVWGKLYRGKIIKELTEYPIIIAGQDLP